ncbi:Transcription initiation factor TFIID, subunit TAF12 (also component of histone acetyltransferase SAGA) [Mycobacteroides abscessus subsp. abscessus]|nr:Transcription initiation factor TFIID, subunit TAF12 (also component of histone acetyltransferase SAGA) [Mycobacteroides abscessus subsp. abscessus]
MNGGAFQPPGLPPQMPDYQGGNNLPPLDQNGGISIYNSGNPQAPQQVPGQQGGQQPQQGWDQPVHGTQPPNYSTAPGYTQGPGRPNPDFQAPQQNSPQQGQQSPQQGQQQQQPNQPEQQQQQPEQQQQEQQQDQSDQQRQKRCEAMSQQMDQITETAGQVADIAQQVGDAADKVLPKPKGGGGSLGPDGERSPGRLPVEPLECGDCPPDRKPQNPLCKLIPSPAAKKVCKDYIDPWMDNFSDECKTGEPGCKGRVPICYPKDVTNPTQFQIDGMRDYINGGNKLIEKNEEKGGIVIKRTTANMDARKREDIKRAKEIFGEAAFEGKAPGHMPDLTWGGTAVDDRQVLPMDIALNQSIGGQSNYFRRFKEGFQVTEFVEGIWAVPPYSNKIQCLEKGPTA